MLQAGPVATGGNAGPSMQPADMPMVADQTSPPWKQLKQDDGGSGPDLSAIHAGGNPIAQSHENMAEETTVERVTRRSTRYQPQATALRQEIFELQNALQNNSYHAIEEINQYRAIFAQVRGAAPVLKPRGRAGCPFTLMPMAREHSSCLEASRAAALAAHSAAGLAAAAGLREAARLLRSCEAMARAATAALQCSTADVSTVRGDAPPAAGQAARVSANAPGVSAAPAARRRKKKNKKDGGVNSEGMVLDKDPAVDSVPAVGAAPAAAAPAAAAGVLVSGRTLEKKCSRERSPYRAGSTALPSSTLASTSSTTSPAPNAGGGNFSVGQAAVLTALVSRPELVGNTVTLRSFDVGSSRWAVTLDTTGESIRVKTDNLVQSIFKPGGT